ncbi:hypothetical protein TCAL_06704 [Tigriopus californicus]|uniref:Prolyl 4-hydroxylase alpha subunit domain-containing protein n=2 Tax=Tigriopus californicus TaxID=6832 RepID=A0A553P7B0_TIGCA|nr:hypothetical protein TCAL_06704 [Tigriopus californicus]|eukprot:TCALIF_06704-PA protein Name:"Similar to P4HA2 Prolyl 4-hydroxylase subunit alpha-2 (Gallus gallus)" AED:0.39 eAED:0.39 QI:0/-1/0/1/-1/1/1/0/591
MNKWLCLIILNGATNVFGLIDYDFNIFENLNQIQNIYHNESYLYEALKTYRTNLVKVRDSVTKDYLQNAKHSETLDHTHPINVFNKIKQWMRLGLALSSKEIKQSRKDLKEVLNEKMTSFPKFEDAKSALRGLLYLFETYGVDPIEASQGKVKGVELPHTKIEFESREVLDAIDFGVMGEIALAENRFASAVDMFKAYDVLIPRHMEAYPDAKNILGFFEGQKKKLIDLNNQYLMKRKCFVGKHFHTTKKLLNPDLTPKKNQGKMAPKHFTADLGSNKGLDYFFQSTCRGESMDTAEVLIRLKRETLKNPPKCTLLHHNNPFLRLAPFPLEIVSTSPYIVIFHGILSEEEIQFLIEYSKPRLSINRDESNRGLDPVHSADAGKVRIVAKSVQCWLKDIAYKSNTRDDSSLVAQFIENGIDHDTEYRVLLPIMYKLSKKIEMATRMNVTGKYSSTDYQTTNYGLGGLCEAHIDPHGYQEGLEIPPEREGLKLTGDMFATFMAWLNDVEAGGATAFLDPGHEIAVWPTKGSAAFWLDLTPIGFRDSRTLHAGCPILKGSKWILNKWIFSYDQFQNYPCGLNPRDPYEGFKGFY